MSSDGDIAAALTQHAYAANTERALRADTAVSTGRGGTAGSVCLPAPPGTVAAFVEAMGGVKAPATVRRYVFSVAMHRAARLPHPCADMEVRLASKPLRRVKGRAQAQAAPLTRDWIDPILARRRISSVIGLSCPP